MNTQVVVPNLPSPTWNREEVEQTVTRMLAEYTNVVYTPDTAKSAKADRAELNRSAKALDDERKRVKAAYTATIERFEREIRAITDKIKSAANEIDFQVKAFEEAEKKKKKEAIREEFYNAWFKCGEFEQIFDEKWLNATTSMNAVRQALKERAEQIAKDCEVLETIEEYRFEAQETYKRTLSLTDAMRTVQERKDEAKRKAEHEARLRGEAERRKAEEAASFMQEVQSLSDEPIAEEVPKVEPIAEKDDLPDLEAMGDGRHAITIHAKVTNADEVAILNFLNGHGVEFYVIGG